MISLRETCTAIAQKHFPEKWKEKRVEFIPIEWRTWLSLDEGLYSTDFKIIITVCKRNVIQHYTTWTEVTTRITK